MDEALLPVADELFQMPWIPDKDEGIKDVIPLKATGTDDARPQDSAANMQQTGRSNGQSRARTGKNRQGLSSAQEGRQERDGRSQNAPSKGVGKKRQGRAPSGTGPSCKRATRFELVTFTLATRQGGFITPVLANSYRCRQSSGDQLGARMLGTIGRDCPCLTQRRGQDT